MFHIKVSYSSTFFFFLHLSLIQPIRTLYIQLTTLKHQPIASILRAFSVSVRHRRRFSFFFHTQKFDIYNASGDDDREWKFFNKHKIAKIFLHTHSDRSHDYDDERRSLFWSTWRCKKKLRAMLVRNFFKHIKIVFLWARDSHTQQ